MARHPAEETMGAELTYAKSTGGWVFLAASAALAGGVGLLGVALAWPPPRGSQTIVKRAQLYAVECANCHGSRLEGQAILMQHGAPISIVPPLGVTGHAWAHSDSDLTTIVVHGTGMVAASAGKVSMPAFADRLSGDEIQIILTYVKSRWPAGHRIYQASLTDGGKALATSSSDPEWTFPGGCLPSGMTVPSSVFGTPH